MLEFKDSTHVWGRRGAMWLELRGKNWPRASLFSLFFLFYCTAYSRAELGGVCESRWWKRAPEKGLIFKCQIFNRCSLGLAGEGVWPGPGLASAPSTTTVCLGDRHFTSLGL